MAQNDFLDRQKKRDQAHFSAGEEMGIQKMWDVVQQALRRPNVVGTKRWGRKKLARLYNECSFLMDYWHEAFTMSKEADYKQEEQDRVLGEIWGKDLVPHKERYPYCKEFNYKKGRKDWK